MKSFVAVFVILAGLVSFAVAEIEARANNVVDGYAGFGGTTGGAAGPTTRVTTLAALKSAVSGNSPKTVVLAASLKGNDCVEIGSNTSLLGAKGVSLTGVGLRVLKASNVVIRNVIISKVVANEGDAIGVQSSSNVWIDHVDLSSDRDHGKDYYDGLLDITHGCVNVTVSWSVLHDHYKASLVGHTDSNGVEDKHITVTYHHNFFTRTNSRGPSVRFGTTHAFNNYYNQVGDGIDTRDGAHTLVEANVFENTEKPLFSEGSSDGTIGGGYAVARNNDFGGVTNTVPSCNFTTPPYSYSLTSTGSVKSVVSYGAGANLSF